MAVVLAGGSLCLFVCFQWECLPEIMLLPFNCGSEINNLNRPEKGFKTNTKCPITSVADFIKNRRIMGKYCSLTCLSVAARQLE